MYVGPEYPILLNTLIHLAEYLPQRRHTEWAYTFQLQSSHGLGDWLDIQHA